MHVNTAGTTEKNKMPQTAKYRLVLMGKQGDCDQAGTLEGRVCGTIMFYFLTKVVVMEMCAF